jgi:heptosyltransferase-2
MMQAKKILVIRFSAIGDIVWTSPVLRMLKKQLPNTEIHFVSKKNYLSLLDANPNIDKIHLLEDKMSDLIKKLRAENFDYIVDLHNNLRSRHIRLMLRKKTFAYNKDNFKKWLLVHLKINKLSGHVVDRYIKAVAPLGIQDDGLGLDFFIKKENEVAKEHFPENFCAGYDVFVIGASEFTKKLPLEKMYELCEMIRKPVVLVGGKDDFDTGEKLFEKFGSEKIWNTCGKFNLAQSASIVKNAEIVYGHDTGLTQIAAAFQKKIYIIFGSTHQSCGFYPFRSPHVIISNETLD